MEHKHAQNIQIGERRCAPTSFPHHVTSSCLKDAKRRDSVTKKIYRTCTCALWRMLVAANAMGIYVYTRMYIYIHMYTYIYIYHSILTYGDYVHIYIYNFVYIYTHTHLHIYEHIHGCRIIIGGWVIGSIEFRIVLL